MSLNADGVARRRRGKELENALLDAAWAELTERGYDEFAIDRVATRAGTSRAVLYRRWPSKQDLVRAAVEHNTGEGPATAPDTGSLRGDVVALLRQTNERRQALVTVLMTRLDGFYRASGTTLADLAEAGSGDSVMREVLDRAIERGEVEPGQVSDRIAQLPVHLFRYEALMTLQPVPDPVIEEIVDTIFLPLVYGNR